MLVMLAVAQLPLSVLTLVQAWHVIHALRVMYNVCTITKVQHLS